MFSTSCALMLAFQDNSFPASRQVARMSKGREKERESERGSERERESARTASTARMLLHTCMKPWTSVRHSSSARSLTREVHNVLPMNSGIRTSLHSVFCLSQLRLPAALGEATFEQFSGNDPWSSFLRWPASHKRKLSSLSSSQAYQVRHGCSVRLISNNSLGTIPLCKCR